MSLTLVRGQSKDLKTLSSVCVCVCVCACVCACVRVCVRYFSFFSHFRIYELKDNKENVFLMEHNAKVHLLREMGVLGNESSGGGSRVRLSSEAGSSSASSSGTFRHEHIADIGKQQSLPS